ncbi:MAG TPA: palindromic element RPE2 domain-containing protein [Rickettsia endosymbiont of Sericostoma sp. HW-2014]|nr:palindromic element RPE2 domain-containing protein [Rickettsia endosymbiont of Sericostoma sp. HW-2014]
MVNSGEVGARSDGATPISNRRATSDNVTNSSSIDYKSNLILYIYYILCYIIYSLLTNELTNYVLAFKSINILCTTCYIYHYILPYMLHTRNIFQCQLLYTIQDRVYFFPCIHLAG